MADNPNPSPSAAAAPYRVLARKYRPRTFEDLIGQDAMVRTLSNAFDTGRIPQAWMLTGVRGVGKTTTARILARGLNFETADGTGRPTIHLPELGIHCPAIIEGRHVDVMEMDAASHTGIGDIREITDAARYKPMSARYKVYIIDEVHMLSTAAFNGLLKTLEEPPEHVKFVFATTEIRKVPVTVLSRCQRFDLRRVEAGLLARHLHKVASAEGVELAPDAAALLARAAEGSVRDSLSLLDQAIAHGQGAVTADVVRAMLGLSDRLRVFDLMELTLKGQAAEALSSLAAQYRDGADPATLIAELADTVHTVTRAKVAPGTDDATAPEAETKRATELAAALSIRQLTRAWQMLVKGLAEVGAAPRPVAAAEMLIVRLAHASDLPTPDELIRRLEAGDAPAQGGGGGGPVGGGGARAMAGGGSVAMAAPRLVATSPAPEVAQMAAQPAVARAPSTVPIERFEDLVLLAQSRRDIPMKVALERSVHPVRLEPGRIEIRLADGANTSIATDLQRKLGEWTGERWLVALSKEAGEPTLHEQAQARQKSLMDDIRAHPEVARLLTIFPGAEIVDVRDPRVEAPPAAEADADLPPDDTPPIEAYEDDDL